MKSYFLLAVFLSAPVFSKSIPKRVAFVDLGRSVGTGYFVKAQNTDCSEGKGGTYFVTAGHVGGTVTSKSTYVPKKTTIDFVTGSSAGNPLEMLKAFVPVAGGLALPAGAMAFDIISYFQIGAEMLGGMHYDLSGSSPDMDIVNSHNRRSVGMFKRLSTQKPTIGTYFRVGMNRTDVSTCQDTLKIDLTDKMPDRTDVEYFKLAKNIPLEGDVLSTLGFPVSRGRAELKGCLYEGLIYAEPVPGLNAPSFLHMMRCPDVLIAQGISGGPVLNQHNEVVGTVTRGGVYYKVPAHLRTNEMMVNPHELKNVSSGYLETVLFFSELTQDNVTCEGEMKLGYQGHKVLHTLDKGVVENDFDKLGCALSDR